MKVFIIVLLASAATIAIISAYSALHWEAGTRELRARLETARISMKSKVVDFRELEGLPAPVSRYFCTVLKESQPMVAAVRVRHQGTFNMGETTDRWKPFTSNQRVITQRPGFDWDARVQMAPGLTVFVHDAYVAGEGVLIAKLLGLWTVMQSPRTPELARGELMRFLAEAAWYPTALLPSQGVYWEQVDARSARATLIDGEITLTMVFTFNDEGLIETVWVGDRGRIVGGQVVPTPWQGRFWNYQEHNGMLVPLDGEVAWLLPEGAKPYWRGRITEIAYEFAE